MNEMRPNNEAGEPVPGKPVAAPEDESDGSRIPDAALEAAIEHYFANSRSDWGLSQQQWQCTCRQLTNRMEGWARSGRQDIYSVLVRGTDLEEYPAWHHVLAEMLAIIAQASHSEGLPMITAVVYGKASNEPGPGFNAAARHLGIQSPGQDDTEFWIEELRRVGSVWYRER